MAEAAAEAPKPDAKKPDLEKILKDASKKEGTPKKAAAPQSIDMSNPFDNLGAIVTGLYNGAKKIVTGAVSVAKYSPYIALYAGAALGSFALAHFNPVAMITSTSLSLASMTGYLIKTKFREKGKIDVKRMLLEGVKGYVLGTGINYVLPWIEALPTVGQKAAALLPTAFGFVAGDELYSRAVFEDHKPRTFRRYIEDSLLLSAVLGPVLLANMVVTVPYLSQYISESAAQYVAASAPYIPISAYIAGCTPTKKKEEKEKAPKGYPQLAPGPA